MPILKQGDKLGQILVKSGLLTQDQIAKALEVQKGTTKRIGEILVDIGLVTELDIASALSKQLGIPYASSASGLLNPQKGDGLEQLIPEEFSRQGEKVRDDNVHLQIPEREFLQNIPHQDVRRKVQLS